MKCGSSKVLESVPIPNFKSIFMTDQLPDAGLEFGIGADSRTFELPDFAIPLYQMGFLKMGFAENLGQYI